jgi:hypothetical protein
MNLLSYENQIYLLAYWLKQNILHEDELTLENIKDSLSSEYSIDDDSSCNDVLVMIQCLYANEKLEELEK